MAIGWKPEPSDTPEILALRDEYRRALLADYSPADVADVRWSVVAREQLRAALDRQNQQAQKTD